MVPGVVADEQVDGPTDAKSMGDAEEAENDEVVGNDGQDTGRGRISARRI